MTESGTPFEVEVEGLSKSFGSNVVLDDLSLTIRRGEIVAIIGASGCGKSVLLHHIVGLLDPDAGTVRVANHEVDGSPLMDLATLDDEQMDQIRVHWAIVFQRNALFSGTVFENIAFWLREIKGLDDTAIRVRAQAALSAVGLDPDAVLEKDRDELSGGMAKRVAVARAISQEPMLIFYDEPTTGLDPDHARQIHDLIVATHDGHPDAARTSVIVTHDKDLLFRVRPRIIVLHDGGILFDGTHDEFITSESPLIRPYFELMPALHRRVPLTSDASCELPERSWGKRAQPG